MKIRYRDIDLPDPRAAHRRLRAMVHDLMFRLNGRRVEKFVASWSEQDRDERKRRFKYVRELVAELTTIESKSGFSTMLGAMAIEAIIEGSCSDVAMWAEHFTFNSEGAEIQTWAGPIWERFRSLLLSAAATWPSRDGTAQVPS